MAVAADVVSPAWASLSPGIWALQSTRWSKKIPSVPQERKGRDISHLILAQPICLSNSESYGTITVNNSTRVVVMGGLFLF